MNDNAPPNRRNRSRFWIYPVVIIVILAGVWYAHEEINSADASLAAPQKLAAVPEATTEEVHRVCAACHAYPPPESFPKSAWRKEVKQGFDFFHKDLKYRFDYPSLEAVVAYYENRAPEFLPEVYHPTPKHKQASQFERRTYPLADTNNPPGVANVNLVHLYHKDKWDILVCDAVNKQVLVRSPYDANPAWKVIARDVTCAHAEVVDLDGDGVNDVVLAVLGNFYATDDRVGSVVWLRGASDGTFTPITLLDGLGRVADVRVADFTGNGKLDLVVAEFGWHDSGSILLMENQTTDWKKPHFITKTLDSRHGTTHVAVADINHDGKPDFVAVITQEHETVVAFLNEGQGKFRKETIYTAPHPAWGCNGVHIVDLDGDGDLDVLLTNGDSLDAPYILRPDHGLTWLENKGTYPFTPHRLANCYGAGSPVTADFDGNGLLDIAFVTFLPGEFFPQREQRKLESVVILEQVTRGEFARQTLEVSSCDHLSCMAADLDGKGLPDLVVGNYIRSGKATGGITIWRNITKK